MLSIECGRKELGFHLRLLEKARSVTKRVERGVTNRATQLRLWVREMGRFDVVGPSLQSPPGPKSRLPGNKRKGSPHINTLHSSKFN